MNQDHDKKMQGQGKQPDMNERQGQGKPQQGSQTGQGQGKPELRERGNPNTTERIQPEPNRGGGQRHEGDKPTGNREQTKF